MKNFENIIWHKSSGIPSQNNNLVDKFEYILGFKKKNKLEVKVFETLKSDYKFNIKTSNLDIWNINRPSGSIAKGVPHPAMYPINLPRRIIKRFSSEADKILDPFLGSGSTIAAAIIEGRDSCGYELNKEYKKIMNIQFEKILNEIALNKKVSHKISFI